MIEDLRKKLDEGKITTKELYDKAISIDLKEKDVNTFVTIVPLREKKTKIDSIIYGIPYTLKDNFSTRGIKTTACSNILKDYVPVYDSTVYKKLKECGAVLVGKTTMDELAMGGTGTTGNTGKVLNPLDKERMIGGSSSGSCTSVVLDMVPFSIGSDTGDSVRKPAAFGGIVGFKPTYGRISRYGLFSFASSLDHVAMFTKSVKDAAIVTDILKGEDYHDMTTLPDEDIKYTDTIDDSIVGKKLFYFKDLTNYKYYESKGEEGEELKQVLESFKRKIELIRKSGVIVEEVDFPISLLRAIYPVYMSISCAEATSNNSNLTGIPFGTREVGESVEDIMIKSRTKGFSEMIKRRFVLGSYILQKENQEKLFFNATRVRRMIVEKMNEIFKDYDGLIMPASGGIAPKFDSSSEVIESKLSDKYLILENHLAIGNFGGFPSITIPSDKVDGMPIAINITGKAKDDGLILNIGNKIEKILKKGE